MKKIFLILILFSSLMLTACDFYYSNIDQSDSINNQEKQDDNNTSDDQSDKVENKGIAGKFLKGTITQKSTILESEHFTFNIEENIYYPGYLLEYTEVIYDAIEKVSGLNFYNEHYNPSKIKIMVQKGGTEKSKESEVSNGAFTYSTESTIYICSGDLLLGNTYAIVHELAHVLMYSQSFWSYSRVYVEGFAEYTSYKTVKYLESNNMNVAKAITFSESHINNVSITNQMIYDKNIQYWIENSSKTYDFSLNGPYALGFRFMSYLDRVYGNYKDWLSYYEEIKQFYTTSHLNQTVNIDNQFKAMTETYGNDVFDGFYDWLKLNQKLFKEPRKDFVYDMSSMEYAYIYPFFYFSGNETCLSNAANFKYKDLYVGIEQAKYYLKEYKKKDISNLKLVLSTSALVELYDSNNNLIERSEKREFDLNNVCYIKLVGEKVLGKVNGIYGLQIVY